VRLWGPDALERDDERDARAGYRVLPHTADLIVEAWGPDRETCLEHAVLGLVSSFADTGDGEATGEVPFHLDSGSDEELLVGLLDEVIYVLDVEGAVPVGVDFEPATGTLAGRFHTVAVEAVESIGAVPKAIAWHGLAFGQTGGRWTAHVVVDV